MLREVRENAWNLSTFLLLLEKLYFKMEFSLSLWACKVWVYPKVEDCSLPYLQRNFILKCWHNLPIFTHVTWRRFGVLVRKFVKISFSRRRLDFQSFRHPKGEVTKSLHDIESVKRKIVLSYIPKDCLALHYYGLHHGLSLFLRPLTANMRSAFEYPVLEQTARGNCDRYTRRDI